MIPYYHFGKLFTVPGLNRDVHVFGVLVVIAIITGVNIAYWKAKQIGVNREKLSSMITFCLVAGFISAHLFDHLIYRWPVVVANPLSLLNFWSGISSYGGFFGAFLAILYYCRRHKLNFLEYSEPVAFGIPFAWIFGRMGCASVHDHIGSKTDFFLGINFPPPLGVRHDLGVYEAIFAVCLSILFFILRNKNEPRGFYLMLICFIYAPVRFYFDSLRAVDLEGADIRYFGLTPAQYSSIAIFIGGIYLWKKIYNKDKRNNPELQEVPQVELKEE
jgi:phosphatidylglycerol:prolipoprotein diacylglycerol transferase